ncbi:MAG TPA: biotin/lipoyl-binding protein [Syntrophorhabdaceae bacterium]|nr:biotin/lipoyl-binding protein [Syntrophorhabdaceae bacterium]
MEEYVFVTPDMDSKEILKKVKCSNEVFFTSTAMRDAGQSDYKNRIRIHDLLTLAPLYNEMGLFSAECHGGARWHVGIMNRKEDPFEEIRLLRSAMPNVLLQTLVRETSLWGYRPYPKNIIEYAVSRVDIDVWRCFSFLNDVRNMRTVAEVVIGRGKIFEPTISFTDANWTTDSYYLGVVDDIISLCGGTEHIILAIKDMAGVGTTKRIGRLIDAIKQKYPDLIIQYHRHMTDGLALPAYLSAAMAGAKIFDVEEDSLVRFYGQPPILAVDAYFREAGINVHLNRTLAEDAVLKVREWINNYEWAESPFRGFDHTVTYHRMPGGAFPSSFEQASKGNFLDLMPAILKVMSLYNQFIHYFDVTPGSQITWVTCSGIVNRYAKEQGSKGVIKLIKLLERFIYEKNQDFNAMEKEEQEELLNLFKNAPDDFKNLILGQYGKLPAGWPADWVYESTFGIDWKEKIQSRNDLSPDEISKNEDLERLRWNLKDILGRMPTDEEFVLYLMHPKDTVEYIEWRDKFGVAPLVLPTDVWRNGLKKPGDKVEFDLWGKPYCIELVSIGAENDGVIHVVVLVNNKTKVYEVQTPFAKKTEKRMAKGPNDIASPVNGTVWRIGNTKRGSLNVGDIVHKGEEIANVEAMKMENVIVAPFDGQILEICVKVNELVQEGQLLFVIDKRVIEKAYTEIPADS